MPKQFGNLTYANYSPQYVGQDVEGIKAVSQTKNQDYDTNLGKQDALELAINDMYSKVRSENGNAQYVKAAYDKAQADLKSIKESGRWEDAQYKVQKAAKDFANNNDVKGALMDKAAYDGWIADLNKKVGMKPEEGGITTEQRDNAVKLAMNNPENKKQTKFNTDKLSFDNIFKGYTPVKYRDIGTRMFELSKDWKESEAPIMVGDKEAKYIPSLNGYYTTGSHEQVSEAEVNKALRQAIMANPEDMAYIQEQEMFHKENNFKNPDGTYRNADEKDFQKLGFNKNTIKELSKTKENPEGIDLDNLSASDKDSLYNSIARDKTLDSYVEPAAEKASYDKIKAHYVRDWVQGIYLKRNLAKQDEILDAGSIETFDNNKTKNEDLSDGLKGTIFEGVKFSETGDFIPIEKTTKKMIGTNVKNPSGSNFVYEKGFDSEKNIEIAKAVGELIKNNPSLKGMKPGDIVKAYAEANKNGRQLSNESHSLGGLNTKKITSDLVKDLNGRQILIDDEQGDGTLEGAIEKLGLSEDEIKEKLLQAQTVSVKPISNNKAGSYKVQVQDKAGNLRELTISTSNEQQSYYDAVAKMAENEKNGKTGVSTFVAQDPTKINKNKGKINDNTLSEFGSVTQIVPDGKGGYIYSTRGGKVYSKKETDAYLKATKLSRKELEAAGSIFTDDGRLMQNLSGRELMKGATTEWMNSSYNVKNRVKNTKDAIEFDDESDNIEL